MGVVSAGCAATKAFILPVSSRYKPQASNAAVVSVDSLKEKILEGWSDSKERENKIKLNLQYVQKFNANIQANQIIDLYEKLISL